jgi:hypothetical protein
MVQTRNVYAAKHKAFGIYPCRIHNLAIERGDKPDPKSKPSKFKDLDIKKGRKRRRLEAMMREEWLSVELCFVQS